MSPERAGALTVDGREIVISHLDKVLFPESGFTKGQMVDYYASIAPVLLPHIRDRPLTMKRFPDGVDGPSFFEKHLPAHAPEWVRHVAVPSAKGDTAVEFGVVCDLPTLIWVANLATIELHVPLWRVGRRRKLPGPPDHMVFDLDPGVGATIVECCTVSVGITELLADRSLDCFPKTSGSKGLQVYVPLAGPSTWDSVRKDAHTIATQLQEMHPELVVSNMRKSLRHEKVLIDWSQNHPSKTTIAAYSLRAQPDPSVSTPLTWNEVARCVDAADPGLLRFTAPEVLDRVEAMGDLFAPVAAH